MGEISSIESGSAWQVSVEDVLWGSAEYRDDMRVILYGLPPIAKVGDRFVFLLEPFSGGLDKWGAFCVLPVIEPDSVLIPRRLEFSDRPSSGSAMMNRSHYSSLYRYSDFAAAMRKLRTQDPAPLSDTSKSIYKHLRASVTSQKDSKSEEEESPKDGTPLESPSAQPPRPSMP